MKGTHYLIALLLLCITDSEAAIIVIDDQPEKVNLADLSITELHVPVLDIEKVKVVEVSFGINMTDIAFNGDPVDAGLVSCGVLVGDVVRNRGPT